MQRALSNEPAKIKKEDRIATKIVINVI